MIQFPDTTNLPVGTTYQSAAAGKTWRWSGSAWEIQTGSGSGSVGGAIEWSQVTNKPGFASVATSGNYADLTGKPTLGTAAATNATDYATANQGAKADAASQPGHKHSLEDLAVSGATNGQVAAWNGTAWVPSTPAASGVSSVAGRDGAVTLAKSDVGLENCDNTSDANKPVSTATQSALNAKVGSDLSGASGATALTNMMQITSAGYSALGANVSVNTLYIIVG